MSRGWLTPDFPPEHKFYSRRLLIPATAEFLGLVNGALVELCLPHNWEQSGEMTPYEAADYFTLMWEAYTHNQDEPPEWETPDDLDGQPEQPWYENLADWVIQGFLAVTFTPAAAIVYTATVPKLRVAIRTGNLGALFRVLINGVEVWTGDSYAPITDLIEQVFDMSAETEPYTVRIEHNGVGDNINGTEAKLEVIRGEAVASMVATILRGDPGGCGIQWSTDDGGTWNTVDLASCITGLANDAILQAIEDGVISPGQTQQPPQPQPAPETCVTYHVKLQPGAMWHCPSPISADTTVVVNNAKGGWSVGELAWYCPDGRRYLAGICDESLQTHVEGDPLNPGAFHMAIVGLFDTTYFDPFTEYTVPGDTEDTELFMTANTNLTGTPSGEVTFDVTVCSSAGWTHIFDFTTEESWVNESPYTSEYVADTGWEARNVFFNPDMYRICAITTSFTERSITAMSVTFDWVNGDNNVGFEARNLRVWSLGDSPENYVYPNTHFEDGTHTITVTGWPRITGELGIVGTCGYNANSGTGPGGTLRITSVTLTGTGTDPFI